MMTSQVRPAFMDEYERLEMELSAHYSMYVQAWRNMSYLESELDEINANEEDRIAENDRQLKMMQRRLREEDAGDSWSLGGCHALRGGVRRGDAREPDVVVCARKRRSRQSATRSHQ